MKLVSQLSFAVVTTLPGGLPKGASLVLSGNGHLYTFDGTVWVDNGVAGSGGSGVNAVNFGVSPGSSDAFTVVTGQSGILATSVLSARVVALATADHSGDEHWVDPPIFVAGDIVPGVGFTIYGSVLSSVFLYELTSTPFSQSKPRQSDVSYGLWSVGWSWS